MTYFALPPPHSSSETQLQFSPFWIQGPGGRFLANADKSSIQISCMIHNPPVSGLTVALLKSNDDFCISAQDREQKSTTGAKIKIPKFMVAKLSVNWGDNAGCDSRLLLFYSTRRDPLWFSLAPRIKKMTRPRGDVKLQVWPLECHIGLVSFDFVHKMLVKSIWAE